MGRTRSGAAGQQRARARAPRSAARTGRWLGSPRPPAGYTRPAPATGRPAGSAAPHHRAPAQANKVSVVLSTVKSSCGRTGASWRVVQRLQQETQRLSAVAHHLESWFILYSAAKGLYHFFGSFGRRSPQRKGKRASHRTTCSSRGRKERSRRGHVPASAKTRALLGPHSRAQGEQRVQTAPGPAAAANPELLQKRTTSIRAGQIKESCTPAQTSMARSPADKSPAAWRFRVQCEESAASCLSYCPNNCLARRPRKRHNLGVRSCCCSRTCSAEALVG